MRAKNEFKFLADAYNTKLIVERVVDGKLMCPKACCGAPVVECTCGPDCPHCNCFMIHKAMKEKDFTNKLLKEFYKMRDPDGDGSWPDDEREEERRKKPDYGEPEYDNASGEYEDGEDSIVPEDERDEPVRGITGMKHKLDALAAAQLAGSKHKPYVSSFVGDESDGFRKIFAVLGSDGKIVHKTRDKREAHQWLKDNYENI